MNIQDTANTKSAYAIGQPVKRKEDGKLLRGQGRYTDDINLPNQAYAYILRSTIAHGRIKSIDTEAGEKNAGRARHLHRRRPQALRHLAIGAAVQEQGRLRHEEAAAAALPTDKVRFVGDPIACVVATTLAQAKDASEAIEVDIETLGVVTTPDQAVAPGRAGAVRGRAGQRRARFPLRRQREGRGGVRGRQAQGQAEDPQHADDRQHDRAARRDRQLRQGEGALHAELVQPGRDGAQGRPRRRDEDDARQGARHHRQCRRLVRHEGAGLSGIRLHPARREGRSAAR